MPSDTDPFSPPTGVPPVFPGRDPRTPPAAAPGGDACTPGSCGAQINAGVGQNQQGINQLQTLLQGVDLGLLAVMNSKLDVINGKLGPQVPGGLSGFLQKFWNSLNLSRILSILTFITTLHNAYMLSNALTQTLFSAFDNVLAIFNVELKDAEGDEIDTSEWVGDKIEDFFKSIFGAQTVDGIQDTWKKYSRIYQAAANLMFSIQSIGWSILGALEVVGNWNASIGNALKKFGVVAENAYRWMNPNVNFQNRYFTAIERAQDMAESIEEITSNVRDVTETVEQIQTQKTELENAVQAATQPEPPESTRTAQQAQIARQVSLTPPGTLTSPTSLVPRSE
ncbi:MAG: hypothetical protein F6K28_15725 [Microcoleus sp. SIO2G3]|nr:hypothetical protein [Microcoleus sp. SIO2G3]